MAHNIGKPAAANLQDCQRSNIQSE